MHSPIWQLPLDTPPRILQAQTGTHGHQKKSQTYHMVGLWCIHWYDYHGGIRIGDWAGEIRPGVVSIVPPGETLIHQWRRKNSRHHYAHFSIANGPPQAAPAWMLDTDDTLHRLMQEVVGSFAFSLARATAALWQCLWHIAESQSPVLSGPSASPVTRIQRQIEQDLALPISLKKCARACDLSPNHANRLFRQATGQTICAYWRKRRIESACGLLAHTSMSVKEVAIQCGYQDLQQFNKLLRLHTGSSPRKLRLVHK